MTWLCNSVCLSVWCVCVCVCVCVHVCVCVVCMCVCAWLVPVSMGLELDYAVNFAGISVAVKV